VQLIVFGNASNSIVKEITVKESDLNEELMTILIAADLPIASSCSGANVCQLCLVNESIVSCQIKVKDFINKYGHRVTLNYL